MNPDFIQTLQAQARSADRLDADALRRAIQDAEYALQGRLSDTQRRTVQMALKALRYEHAQRQRDALGAGPDETWSDSWDTSAGSAKDAAAAASKASQGAAKQANKPASSGGAKQTSKPPASPPEPPASPPASDTSDTSDTAALLLGGGIAVVAVVAGAELFRQKKRERARQAGGNTP